MKQRRANYRKIYEQHYGPIPVDANGKTYDIHHIDGNRDNNDPSNLLAVSINEHYDIHHLQGDSYACLLISKDMDVDPAEKSRLARESALKRIADGTHNLLGDRNPVHKLYAEGKHPWQDKVKAKERGLKLVAEGKCKLVGGEVQKKTNKRRVEDKTHHLLGGKIQKESQKKLVDAGVHSWQSDEHKAKSREREYAKLENGTHPFTKMNEKLITEGRHTSQIKKTCEHCGKTVAINMYKPYHGDNCKHLVKAS